MFLYDMQISRKIFAASGYSRVWIRGIYLLVGEGGFCIFTVLAVIVNVLRGWQVQLNNAVLCSSCHSTGSITSQLSAHFSKCIPILRALPFLGLHLSASLMCEGPREPSRWLEGN